MKRFFLTLLVFCAITSGLFATNNYDEIFAPLANIQNILKYLGGLVLILSLIAQGVITFFGDNIPDMVKKTMGKVATGGCLIGGSSAIAGLILPTANLTAFYYFSPIICG